MNDLHELLEEASTPSRDWLADSHVLLREGRRRVRRRRLRVCAAGSVLAVVVAGGGVTATRWLHGNGSNPNAIAATSYADLDLTPLSSAEVAARCAPQLAADGVTDFTVADSITFTDGTEHQSPRPWHAGSVVYVRTPGSSTGVVGCLVPESADTAAPVGMTHDAAAMADVCSARLGIDVTHWQPLAETTSALTEAGIFRSGNGYVAACSVNDYGDDSPVSTGDVTPPDQHFGQTGRCLAAPLAGEPATNLGVDCLGWGRVRDHSAAAVDVTLPSGRVVRAPAVDGYWAITVRDDASRAEALGPQLEYFAAHPAS
jgi:hypothetical protein